MFHAALLAALTAAGSHADADMTPDAARQAVQREFRDFRIVVYDSFRTDRTEYDRRRDAGQQVFDGWDAQRHGATSILEWYQQAQAASQGLAALPPMPEFSAAASKAVADEVFSDIARELSAANTAPLDLPTDITLDTAEASSIEEPTEYETTSPRTLAEKWAEPTDERDPFDDWETEAANAGRGADNRNR